MVLWRRFGTVCAVVAAGLEARPVPQTDPRVALRGQLGLYIRDGFQIEAGTVLGAVACQLHCATGHATLVPPSCHSSYHSSHHSSTITLTITATLVLSLPCPLTNTRGLARVSGVDGKLQHRVVD